MGRGQAVFRAERYAKDFDARDSSGGIRFGTKPLSRDGSAYRSSLGFAKQSIRGEFPIFPLPPERL